jgi:alkylation response protein AidB-like acyl-CoA dehydrogenase
MNFDFSEEQRLLQKTVHDYLAEHCALEVTRKVLESNAPYDASLWQGAAELGWLGTTIPEEYGGAGFGHLELALIAEEVGRALAPIPFSSSVYLATEAILRFGSPEQKQSWLPRLANGTVIGTAAVAEGAGEIGEGMIQARFEKGRVNGTKLPVADGAVAGVAVVAARSGDGVGLYLVDLAGSGISREPVKAIDPSRGLAVLTLHGAPAEPLPGARSWSRVDDLLDRAAVLMAFEQVGGASRAFEVTKSFTMGRYAFGRPVASFQALKHRMADAWVAIELARSNGYYGAWALSNDAAELPIAACLARASATDAFENASREMIQMHGGVGFTWEYDCHLFYRRSKLLATALGGPGEWRDKLITRLETNRSLAHVAGEE